VALRATFLLPRYGWHPNGGYRVVYTYANILAARGWKVVVVHPRRLPPGGWPAPRGLRGTLRRAAGRLREAVVRPSLSWAEPDSRVRMLYVPDLSAGNVPDGDVIIATWWSTLEAAMQLPARKGVPLHLVQGYETWHGSEGRVRAALRAPVHKVFVASWLRDMALELGVPVALTTHIPNAIDAEAFRLKCPVEGRPPRVATLGSSDGFKGTALALQMLERARDEVPTLEAVVFGTRRLAQTLPPFATFLLRPDARRLAQEFNACAIYLCASLSEGWHMPPAEAMACGCTLVSSDIGGVRDYAGDGDTALLFPPADVEGGAERLVRLLRDDELRSRLARRGRERIAGFTWERSGERFWRLLEEIASARLRT
jgi:glycosyltransferase involved in cell wall biosynthesis